MSVQTTENQSKEDTIIALSSMYGGSRRGGERVNSNGPPSAVRYAQIKTNDNLQGDATNHLQSEATDLVPSPRIRPDPVPEHLAGLCPFALALRRIAPRALHAPWGSATVIRTWL